MALVAGFALAGRCFTSGNRLHLFIGMAFVLNGAEDLVQGVISFRNLLGLPEEAIARAMPATYVPGRSLLAFLLRLGPALSRAMGKAGNPFRETLLVPGVAGTVAAAATVAAFFLPLPSLVFVDHTISRPLDLLSAILLMGALVVLVRAYRREGDFILWWVILSVAVNIQGQLLMSLSREFYDPFFDLAHLYKVLGYLLPLLGIAVSQVRLLALSDEAADMIYRMGLPGGEYEYVGPASETIRGFTPEDFYQDPLLIRQSIHPASQEPFEQEWANLLKGEVRPTYEYRILAKGGQEKTLFQRNILVRDEAGTPVAIGGIVTDVTSRVQAEEEARRSAERLSLALEGASDGLWDWDLTTDEVFLSPRWKEMLGYRDDDLANSLATWEELVHPEDLPMAKAAVGACLSRESDEFRLEVRMRHKEGGERVILSRAGALRDEATGRAIRLVGTHVDLTPVRRLEEDLLRSRARLQGSVDVTADLVTQVDAHGKILFANWAAEPFLGLSPEKCVGMPAFDFIHPDDRESTEVAFRGWFRVRCHVRLQRGGAPANGHPRRGGSGRSGGDGRASPKNLSGRVRPVREPPPEIEREPHGCGGERQLTGAGRRADLRVPPGHHGAEASREAAGGTGPGPEALQRRAGAVRLRGIPRPPGTLEDGGQLHPAPRTALR